MRLKGLTIIVIILLSAFTPYTSYGKGKRIPDIYMFGVSASFKDSVVYFTDIQKVDSVWIDTKSKFLLGRENYSLQLKNYLSEKQNSPYRTCIIMFANDKKGIEKKFVKLREKYIGKKSRNQFDVRYINVNDFRFKCIDMGYDEEYNASGNE